MLLGQENDLYQDHSRDTAPPITLSIHLVELTLEVMLLRKYPLKRMVMK